MRFLTAAPLLALWLPAALAADQPKPAAPRRAAAKAAPAAPVTAIPADAQEVGVNLFRHVDAEGKAWVYRRTPFGISRAPEAQKAAVRNDRPRVTVTEEGDTITFTQPTPFGQKTWTRERSALTAGERKLMEQAAAAKTREQD